MTHEQWQIVILRVKITLAWMALIVAGIVLILEFGRIAIRLWG